MHGELSVVGGGSLVFRHQSEKTKALGVAIDTPGKLRIVSLGRRNHEVHVRSELEAILVIVAGREHRLGCTSILAHQASHIAKPMRRGEQRECALMEE